MDNPLLMGKSSDCTAHYIQYQAHKQRHHTLSQLRLLNLQLDKQMSHSCQFSEDKNKFELKENINDIEEDPHIGNDIEILDSEGEFWFSDGDDQSKDEREIVKSIDKPSEQLNKSISIDRLDRYLFNDEFLNRGQDLRFLQSTTQEFHRMIIIMNSPSFIKSKFMPIMSYHYYYIMAITNILLLFAISVYQAYSYSQATLLFLGDRFQINATNSEASSHHYVKLNLPSFDPSQEDTFLSLSGFSNYQHSITFYTNFIDDPDNISESDFPTPDLYDQKCSNKQFISCLYSMRPLVGNQTFSLLIHIHLPSPSIFQFTSSVITPHKMKQNSRTYFQLSATESIAVYEFEDYNLEKGREMFFVGEYYSDKACKFRMELLDNSLMTVKSSVSIAAQSQAFKLNSQHDYSGYLLKVSGIPSCTLSLGYNQLNNQLSLNHAFWYLYDESPNQPSSFQLQLNQSEADNPEQYKITVDVTVKLGQAILEIKYCRLTKNQDLEYYFVFEPNGNYNQIIIPVQQRLACLSMNDSVQAISIITFPYQQKFFTAFIRQIKDSEQINLYDTIDIHTVSTAEMQKYELMWLTSRDYVFLEGQSSKSISESLNVALLECEKVDECKEIAKESNQSFVDIDQKWNIQNIVYYISISSKQTPIQYSMSLTRLYPQFITLNFFSQLTDMATMHQMNFYQLNITNHTLNNYSQAALKVHSINGHISLLFLNSNSFSDQQHCYNATEEYNYDSDFVFNETDGEVIYFCVRGLSESIYEIQPFLIQAYPDPDPQPDPEPQPLPQLIQYTAKDGINTFGLVEGTTYLIGYKAHFYPYSVSISPEPDCLQVYESQAEAHNLTFFSCLGQQGSFEDEFREKQIYFRVYFAQNDDGQSNSTDIHYLTVSIVLPQIQLRKFQQVAITCQSYCSTEITIQLETQYGAQMNLTHYGQGIISNDSTYLDCPNNQLNCNVTIEVILPFGGTMFLEDEEIGSEWVSWSQERTELSENSVNLLIKLNDYSSVDTLLLRYPGSCVDVFYTLFEVNSSQNSFGIYGYYPPGEALFSESCLAFKEKMSIELADISPHCQQNLCFVTMTINQNLAVLPPTSLPKYLHYSINSDSRILPISIPYQVREIYGTKYYKLNREQIDQSQVSLIPLSLCNACSEELMGDVYKVQILEACEYVVISSRCGYVDMIEGLSYRISEKIVSMNGMYYNQKSSEFRVMIESTDKSKNRESVYLGAKYIGSDSTNQSLDQCQPLNKSQNPELFIQFNYDPQSGTFSTSDSYSTFFINHQSPGSYLFTLSTSTNSSLQDIFFTFTSASSKQNSPTKIIIKANESPITLPVSQSHSFEFKYYSSRQFKICLKLSEFENWSNESKIVIERVMDENTSPVVNQSINFIKSSNISDNCLSVSDVNSTGFIFGYQISIQLKEEKEKKEKKTETFLEIQIIENPFQYQLYPSAALNIHNGMSMNCFKYADINQQQIQVLLTSNSLGPALTPKVFAPPLSSNTLNLTASFLDSASGSLYKLNIRSESQNKNDIQWCIQNFAQDYSIVVNHSPEVETILPTQAFYHQMSDSHQNFDIYQVVIPHQHMLTSNEQQPEIVDLIIEVIPCITNSIALQIVGTTNYEDIMTGKITQISEEFKDLPNIQAARGIAVAPGYYYIGIKSINQTIESAYSIKTYVSFSGQLPYKNWELATKEISSIEYYDQQNENNNETEPYLMIILPKILNKKKSGEGKAANITYELLLANASEGSAMSHGRCPQNNIVHKEIAVQQYILLNPQIPLFKIQSKQLPHNISIWATATVSNDLTSQPLKYFYNEAHYQIQDQEEDDGGSSKGILWLVSLVILGVFIGILLRFFLRVFKRRRNTVDFQMTESSRSNQNPMVEQSSRAQPENRDTGYGEFVDEVG